MINRIIDKWFDFDAFDSRTKKTSGIVIVLDQSKVLLCHPVNTKPFGSYSFPKGQIDSGETEIQAAIRELEEETSIKIRLEQIKNQSDPIIIEYDRKGKRYKKLFLYIVYIKSLSEIGLTSEIIPIDKIQATEIDWVGFLPMAEAGKRISKKMKHILNIV